jgi:putative transposase
MASKRYKPEEMVAKLRQFDAVWSIGITDVTGYRWRSEFGGLKTDRVK